MKRQKNYKLLLNFFLGFLTIFGPIARASAEQTLRQLYDQGIYFVTPLSLVCSNNSAAGSSIPYSAVGKKVFYIGDSITVGMANDGGLLTTSSSDGLNVTTTYETTDDGAGNPRLVGPSIEATQGWKTGNTLDRLKQRANAVDIKKSDFGSENAEVIVVALGTNQEEGFKNKVVDFIKYLRTANATAKIFWVKTNFKGNSPGNYSSTVNKDIDDAIVLSGDSNMSVIDPNSDVSLSPDSGDVHFTSEGSKRFANFIIGSLSGKIISIESSSGTTVTSGIPDPPNDLYKTSSEDTHKYVWSYLVNEKHLTPNAAAGLMGNFEAEAGNNPWRIDYKDTKEQPEIPSITGANGAPEVDPIVAGNTGYGIVQWTNESHQRSMLYYSLGMGPAPLFNKPRSSGNLRFQLDFMWFDLESSKASAAWTVAYTKLKDPNVTLEEASDIVAINYEAPGSVNYTPRVWDETTGDWKKNPRTGKIIGETFEQYLIDKEKSLTTRRNLSQQMLQKYQGTTYDTTKSSSTSTLGACASQSSTKSTGEAAKYIPDCGANGGNAAIACTAINQLSGIPYSQPQAAAADDPDPQFLDCSGLTNMAIYRTFGYNPALCSVNYLSNEKFQVIEDIRTIQPGDLVGQGTACGGTGGDGHIALVVSYDPATKKLITVESSGGNIASGLRGVEGTYDVHLQVDNDVQYSYQWAVRYIGDKVLQDGAL